jgi:hypothetical protein
VENAGEQCPETEDETVREYHVYGVLWKWFRGEGSDELCRNAPAFLLSAIHLLQRHEPLASLSEVEDGCVFVDIPAGEY